MFDAKIMLTDAANLAIKTNTTVFSVDYRKLPENKFPGPQMDC